MLCKHTMQFAVGLSFVFVNLTNAQIPDSLWTRYYNANEIEICLDVIETADNGLMMAGYSSQDTLGYLMLVKAGSNGNPFWSRTYGSHEQGTSIVQAPDGGYIIGGMTGITTNNNFWMMKANANGDSLWSRTFGGPEIDVCRDIIPASDGGYLLAGYSESFGAGSSDIFIVKTDANGGGLWTRTYGSDGYELLYDAARTHDNGYILAGTTDSLATWGETDCWLVKTNADGDTQWTRTFGGASSEFFFSVQPTLDGGYIAGGATGSNSAGSYDFYIVKTNQNGVGQWARTFGDIGDDECSEVRVLSDGGFIASGPTGSFGTHPYGTWILRLDANGDTLWSKVLRPDTTGYPFCATLISDGGYVMAGGAVRGLDGNQDMMVTKLAAIPLPVTDVVSILPSQFALSNFPNPFNPLTTIQFSMPQPGHATLSLFDVNGRQIETLLDDNLTTGEYNVSFDGANLPSGTYFARLQANTTAATHKIVLLK